MNKPHGTSAWRKYDDYIRHIKENTNLPWHIEELRIKSTVVDPLFSKTTSVLTLTFCSRKKGQEVPLSLQPFVPIMKGKSSQN